MNVRITIPNKHWFTSQLERAQFELLKALWKKEAESCSERELIIKHAVIAAEMKRRNLIILEYVNESDLQVLPRGQ